MPEALYLTLLLRKFLCANSQITFMPVALVVNLVCVAFSVQMCWISIVCEKCCNFHPELAQFGN